LFFTTQRYASALYAVVVCLLVAIFGLHGLALGRLEMAQG